MVEFQAELEAKAPLCILVGAEGARRAHAVDARVSRIARAVRIAAAPGLCVAVRSTRHAVRGGQRTKCPIVLPSRTQRTCGRTLADERCAQPSATSVSTRPPGVCPLKRCVRGGVCASTVTADAALERTCEVL